MAENREARHRQQASPAGSNHARSEAQIECDEPNQLPTTKETISVPQDIIERGGGSVSKMKIEPHMD
jgi:hypothetical protein